MLVADAHGPRSTIPRGAATGSPGRDPQSPHLSEIERDIDGLPDTHEAGKLLLTIDGIGLQTAARIIAAVGNPARFKSAAFAAYVGVVPGLKQSGKNPGRRAACASMGNARLRRALWMPVLGAVRRNAWLKPFYEGLIARGKPPKLALIAAMRKLLHAVYSVAKTVSCSRSDPSWAEENACWT